MAVPFPQHQMNHTTNFDSLNQALHPTGMHEVHTLEGVCGVIRCAVITQRFVPAAFAFPVFSQAVLVTGMMNQGGHGSGILVQLVASFRDHLKASIR